MEFLKLVTKLAFFFVIILTISSCESDDDPVPEFQVPDAYVFMDESGNNTVDFSGQATRLNQLEELVEYIESARTPGTSLDESQLLEMYSNQNGEGSAFFSDNANSSGKQLRDKTARGNIFYQEKFDNLLLETAAASKLTLQGEYIAANGIAGVIRSGESKYLVSAKGIDYAEMIEKGLMGAVFYDQIQNGYLGSEKLNVDNESPVDPENGKFYTTMEHHWDEAFGYFTTATDFPVNGTGRFWGKYSQVVNEVLDSNEKIMNAYLTGRAAITNKDYATRDEQVRILRLELEKLAAATGIHYLNGAISNFTDDAIRLHELTEAVGFIESLYFTAPETAVIETSGIEEILELLKDSGGDYNFYEVEPASLESARDKLAAYAGLNDVKSEL